MKKPKIISEKIVYQSDLTKVFVTEIELSDGKKVEWDWIDNSNVVAIIPIDEKGNVYLCKEWRPAWKSDIIQIPAGGCNAEDEEGRLKQVHNELREEIGMDAKKVEKLITYYGGGRMNYIIHLYLAQGLFPSKKDPDEGEIIEIIKMPFEEAYKLFIKGKEPTLGSTVIGLLLAKDKLGRN